MTSLAKYREGQKRLIDGSSTGTQRPPRVSTKDNRFTLINPDSTRTDIGPIINVVFVDRNEKTSKLFWGRNEAGDRNKPYNPQELSPPVCFSDNGIAPSDQAQDPQSPTCASCEWNRIGTEIGFKGGPIRACEDLKKLAVVVPGCPGVFLFEIKKGSFKNWGNYISHLRMKKLVDGGAPDLTDVVTEIKFVSQGVMAFEDIAFTEDHDEVVKQVIDVWEINKQNDPTGLMVGRYDQPAQGVLAKPQGLQQAHDRMISEVKQEAGNAPKKAAFAPPQQGEKNIFQKAPEPEPAPAPKGRLRTKKDTTAPIQPAPPQQAPLGMQAPQQGAPPGDLAARLDSLMKLPSVK